MSNTDVKKCHPFCFILFANRQPAFKFLINFVLADFAMTENGIGQ